MINTKTKERHQRKTMTRERIAELRSKQHDYFWTPPWILRELLDEIERLQPREDA